MATKPVGTIKSLPLLYRLVPPCVLSLVTLLTYFRSLHYNFQFDDIANIKKHFVIRHYDFWGLFFSGSRWITYWLNSIHYSIGKFDPFSYRVGNLIIHTTNGILVFFVVLYALAHSSSQHFFRRNAVGIATVTSMLFLLHPVQTQTVSYVIQGQLEGLACMFILAIIFTFLHLCYTNTLIKKIIFTGLLFGLAAISCGTKEIAFISPFLVMLVDWFFVSKGSWQSFKKRLWLHGLLFMLITSIYLYFLKPAFFTNILSFKMEVKNNIGNIITHTPQEKIRPWGFFISQFKVILHYIWMFIWPFNISVEYDWVLSRSFFAPDCILPFLALLIIGLTIFRVLYTKPTHVLCFGALWFFVCITPRSSIIPSPELLVDYKTYTASIGWLLILACGIIKLIEYLTTFIFDQKAFLKTRQARLMLASTLMIPLSLMTWQRNLVWSSGTAFWMNVIDNAPYKARAYNNYAVELSQIYKRYEEAIPFFIKATKMDKQYADPWNNLAVCYSHLNKIDKAIEALIQGLEINPHYPEGYNNLASFYLRKKDYDKVLTCLKTALTLRPHYGKAYFNLGRMYSEQGNHEKALECYKSACTIADLDNEFGYQTYAQAAFTQQKYAEAIWAYHKVLECSPNKTEIMFNLANTYYLSKQYGQAVKAYRHLLTLKPNDIRVWYNLSESYFMQENIEQAFECVKQIEDHWKQLPQICIRMAACYEKTGQPKLAKRELQKVLHTRIMPSGIKAKAKHLLVQLEEQYPEAKIPSVVIT